MQAVEYPRTPTTFEGARALARSTYQDYLEHAAFCPMGCNRCPILHAAMTNATDLMNELRPARQQPAVVGA